MPRFKYRAFKLIRMRVQGCTNRPFYEIVVTPKDNPRQGRPTEVLGFYEPLPNLNNEKILAVNLKRVRYWMGEGALLSQPLERLLGLSGFLPVHPIDYLDAFRNRKKLENVTEKGEDNVQSAS
ncbi:hypothetical protein LOTGIDRAFT_220505 [Lottia gigantea]|uniref:Small ribosomal subunit protein bS16m n=1 Tax=Lottia gigantea TaxID=225164 RepID=V3ZQS9_LOTGI|nr:hypothetical protein LOTGIDRAFT_220505 [Lottia gigantea]ESO86712.1 hypothetical protein LOTGIDRAFT_220505 [Lottia gigantea]